MSALPLLALALLQSCAFAAPVAQLDPLEVRFRGFDLDTDGIVEIRRVWSLGLDRDPAIASGGTVLIIVSPALLASPGPGEADGPLEQALATHADDLAAEGRRVRVVAMNVYDGPAHQDGRTLLAMRRYVLAVSKACPDLAGVTLIGSFPEAMLVRQYNWRQRQKTTLHAGEPGEQNFGDREVCRLRSRAELVAGRSDLPLADLDGNWEALYRKEPQELPWVLAVYPELEPPAGVEVEGDWPIGGPTAHYETGTDRFEDFFFIQDGQYDLDRPGEGLVDLTLAADVRDGECAEADLMLPNPLARPDISVSRIDTTHVALRPRRATVGRQGEGLLDESGLPREVVFASAEVTPRGTDVWEPDPELAVRLLCEYLDRVHRYRRGDFDRHLRPASAAFELDSLMPELRQAKGAWADTDATEDDLQGETATLDQVVRWLQRPAVLRALAAHSDPWGANFAKAESSVLAEACGGRAWSWTREDHRLVPTLGSTGKLDYPVLRTLWQNAALPDTGSFYLHSGCESMMPAGCPTKPYNDPAYAHWQGAESLLFYGKGLALVGRSKVFYDFPREFAAKLGEGSSFGEAWCHYYEVEAAATDVAEVGGGIGRKRAYFWGVIGDWTLTLRGV